MAGAHPCGRTLSFWGEQPAGVARDGLRHASALSWPVWLLLSSDGPRRPPQDRAGCEGRVCPLRGLRGTSAAVGASRGARRCAE